MTTVWCTECGGTADVVEERTEEDHCGLWWVRLLDCGHEESVSHS